MRWPESRLRPVDRPQWLERSLLPDPAERVGDRYEARRRSGTSTGSPLTCGRRGRTARPAPARSERHSLPRGSPLPVSISSPISSSWPKRLKGLPRGEGRTRRVIAKWSTNHHRALMAPPTLGQMSDQPSQQGLGRNREHRLSGAPCIHARASARVISVGLMSGSGLRALSTLSIGSRTRGHLASSRIVWSKATAGQFVPVDQSHADQQVVAVTEHPPSAPRGEPQGAAAR